MFTFAHFFEKYLEPVNPESLDYTSIPSTLISIKWRLPGPCRRSAGTGL